MNENLADAISVRNPKNRSIKNVRGIVGTKASKHRSFVRENLVTGRGRGGSRGRPVSSVLGGVVRRIYLYHHAKEEGKGEEECYIYPTRAFGGVWFTGGKERWKRDDDLRHLAGTLLSSFPPEKKRWLRLVANISLHIHPRVTYIKYISSRTHVFVSALHSPYVSLHVPKE